MQAARAPPEGRTLTPVHGCRRMLELFAAGQRGSEQPEEGKEARQRRRRRSGGGEAAAKEVAEGSGSQIGQWPMTKRQW